MGILRSWEFSDEGGAAAAQTAAKIRTQTSEMLGVEENRSGSPGVFGHCVCAENRVPVEGFTKGGVWKFQFCA